MQNTRILISVIFCALVSCQLYAQTDRYSYALTNSLFVLDEETIDIAQWDKADSQPKAIYMIITPKLCSKCFIDFCENINLSDTYKGYDINVVNIIDNDLMKVMNSIKNSKDLVPCAENVLFHFPTDTLLTQIYNSPSPQVIVKDENGMTYLDYSAGLQLLKSIRKTL